MGTPTTLIAHGTTLSAFARRLHDEFGAVHVYLFGSHATGRAAPDSDYDLIIVSAAFEEIPRLARHFGMHDLFYELGGNAPLDLVCLTPDEFESAKKRITLVSAVMPEAIDLLAEESAPA